MPDGAVRGLLGLAYRAGGVVQGVEAVRTVVRSGDARLVILAGDAAPGQLGKVLGLLEHRRVPVRWVDRREALGSVWGREALTAIAITNESFADQLLNRLSARSLQGRDGGGAQGRSEPKEESGINAGR